MKPLLGKITLIVIFCGLCGMALAVSESVSAAEQEDIQTLRQRAEQGDTDAQFNLGLSYYQGQGVKQSDKQAVYWWRKAAEQGDPIAQFNLGLMYEDGRGVAQNDAKAVYWYQKAAEQGNVDAQFNLALMYEDGRGVAQNDAKAVYWYQKAAKQGDAGAQAALDNMQKTRSAPEKPPHPPVESIQISKRAQAAYDYLHDNLDISCDTPDFCLFEGLFNATNNDICHITAFFHLMFFRAAISFNMSDVDTGSIITRKGDSSRAMNFELIKGKPYKFHSLDKDSQWEERNDKGGFALLIKNNADEDRIMKAFYALAIECGAADPLF